MFLYFLLNVLLYSANAQLSNDSVAESMIREGLTDDDFRNVRSEKYFTEEPTTMTTSSKTTVYTTTIADTTTTSYKYTTTFTTTTTPFVTTTGDYSSTRTTGTIISTTYTTRAPLTKPGDSLVNPYRPTVKPLYPDPSKDNNEPTSTATTSTMTTTTMTTTTSTTGTNSGIFGDQSQSSSNDLSRGLQYISTKLLLFGPIVLSQISSEADAENYAQNIDSDGDNIADSQFSGLICWTCQGTDLKDCAQKGSLQKCSQSQVRTRDGTYNQIHMGCKSAESCVNERNQNFHGFRPGTFQCKLGDFSKTGPSVCRQCCNTSQCTGQDTQSFWIPKTKWQWSTNIHNKQ